MNPMSAAPAPRFEPHNRVAGKFRLGKRLATGGMGEVWVARNESTGAEVALKMLRRGDADRERELRIEERFRHEARLSAMLSHRSIVKVFDLIEEADGTLILVMELLRGETLQSYLERKGARPAREGVAIIAPILSALSHAHDRGIVHRDITPSNIFMAVDPDMHVTPKLVDFGIAKLVSGATLPASKQVSIVQTIDGRVLGTPRYMAPERIRGSSEVDGRADLFSIGVVLYETLTGVSPFSASSASASLAAVLERHVDPDPRIEPRLWLEIQRAIAKNAYERHATAQELATELRAAVGESEGALDASLRRNTPHLAWQSDELLFEGPAREKTIEGQSVVVVPRKRVSSAAWLVAGALMGAAIGAVALGLRGLTQPAPRSASPEPVAASSGASRPVPAAGVGMPAASGAEAAESASAATAATAGASPPTGTNVTTGAAAPKPSAPRPAVRPKSIATTPGF
jgi:serine/threonine-protein kinase